MPLTGELTDLSLAELIEFFCNQRKTGRLMVEYPHSPAYFYLHSGAVVHASIGTLRGIEAVYYALTQSNASFKFSSAIEAPEQTINQPWTSVVLEGLRRMDEGIQPRNPFPDQPDPVIQHEMTRKPEQVSAKPPVEQPASQADSQFTKPAVEQTPAVESKPVAAPPTKAKPVAAPVVEQAAVKKTVEELEPQAVAVPASASQVSVGFLSSTQSASRFSQGPWKLGAIFAALVLIVGGIAVPWYARGKGQKVANQPSQPDTTASQPAASDAASQSAPVTEAQPTESAEQTTTTATSSDASDTAKRERDARAREEARLKARENAAAPATASQPAAAPNSAPSAAAGSKKVTVQVTYDENGRVTGASGSDPTALRIARQKRFPAGKAGTATVTIPIN
jgi:outer membrane biosynthesis protein TonB